MGSNPPCSSLRRSPLLQQVGRELGARYVVEGSVPKSLRCRTGAVKP
jgi:TolB-like protein